MLTTEFNMEDAIEVWKEEFVAKGIAEGMAIGEARGEAKGKAYILSLLEGRTSDEIKEILHREQEKLDSQ